MGYIVSYTFMMNGNMEKNELKELLKKQGFRVNPKSTKKELCIILKGFLYSPKQ